MRKLSMVAFLLFVVLVGVVASLPLNAQIRDVPPTPSLLEPVATAELRGQNTVLFQWTEPLVAASVTKFKLKVINDFGGFPTWSGKFKVANICASLVCEVDTNALPGGLKQKFIAGQYTWSVVSINADGNSVAAARMFQLFPLDEPTLVAPTDEEVISDEATLDLHWTYNAADDPVKVKITVFDDKDRVDHAHTLAYGVCSGGDCVYTTPVLRNDNYTVKVKLINKLKSQKMSADFEIAVPAR